MRLRLELVPVGLVVALAVFVLTSSVRASRSRARREAAAATAALAADTMVVRSGVVQAKVQRALVPTSVTPAASPEEMRRRVRNLAPGTYIDDVLAAQDSGLYRWPERLSDALRIYVEPVPLVRDWDPRYVQTARAVFGEWSAAGFPLRFTFIFDSASADIGIYWRDRFGAEEGQRIGVTDRIQSSAFQIVRARVGIALHDSVGRPMSAVVIGGILRHEIGHALGLNHAKDASSVMYHESATSTISPSDRATLRLIYLVPGGSLK